MTTRITVATQIYAALIFRDLQASIRNPMVNAQRALLFADALLICAAHGSGTEEGGTNAPQAQSQTNKDERAIQIRAAKARFARQLESRRGPENPPVH